MENTIFGVDGQGFLRVRECVYVSGGIRLKRIYRIPLNKFTAYKSFCRLCTRFFPLRLIHALCVTFQFSIDREVLKSFFITITETWEHLFILRLFLFYFQC